MFRELNVSSWVVVRKGCPIAHSVHNEGEIEFRLGTRWDGFEFVFEVDALRAFVEAAQDAIAAALPPAGPHAPATQHPLTAPVGAPYPAAAHSGVPGGRHFLKSQ